MPSLRQSFDRQVCDYPQYFVGRNPEYPWGTWLGGQSGPFYHLPGHTLKYLLWVLPYFKNKSVYSIKKTITHPNLPILARIYKESKRACSPKPTPKIQPDHADPHFLSLSSHETSPFLPILSYRNRPSQRAVAIMVPVRDISNMFCTEPLRQHIIQITR